MTLENAKDFTNWFFKGARKEIGELLVFVAIILLIYAAIPWNKDDSDTPGWFARRSGMTPRTDQLTGCQYLESSKGVLVPRMNKDGKQVGCR